MERLLRNKRDALALLAVVAILLAAMAACTPEEFAILAINMTSPGTTEDGVDYGVEDILVIEEDSSNWIKLFDGSEYGLTPKHNIQAFSFNELLWWNILSGTLPVSPTLIPELYMSFAPNSINVPGAGKVAGQDIVRFSNMGPGAEFELYFDGSDVGLTTNGEKIDGLGVMPPEYLAWWTTANAPVDLPYDCNAGVIFVTTMGKYRVPAAEGGVIRGFGSDVLLFCAFNTGSSTSGVWYRVFNGKQEGITPYSAGFGIDVFGFALGDLGPFEQAPDLDAEVAFFFTPRTTFTAPGLDEPGQRSQLFAAITNEGVEGPIVDFNDPVGSFPAVNGDVDSMGLFDFSGFPAP